jgi:hypothetical protein
MNSASQDAHAVTAPPNPWKQAPHLREVVLLWIASGICFVSTVVIFRHYWQLVHEFGDSAAYIEIADAIRFWNFSGIHVKHFWGLPYATAGLSFLIRIPNTQLLIAVSALSALCAVIFAYRLWGGWVAALTLTLNLDWWQRSFLGGSEPLFVALLFASFLAIRKERWYWASFLAALATICRPLGIFLLVGIAVTLLLRHQWRRLLGATCIGAFVGIVYALPLKIYLHDPLATVHSYGVVPSATYPALFGIPFKAIIVGTLLYPAPVTNLLLTFGWILLVLAGNVAMFATSDFREYAKQHISEAIFLALYLLSLYSYNAPVFARGNFARFAIPIVPFVFLALLRWLPKDRRLLWILAPLTAILAACSAIGLRTVITELHKIF